METKPAKKMLIVDDEPDIVEFLSYNFRKKGFEIYAAYDGIQALDKAEAIVPDIIITDILMPNMNGIIMCSQFKSNEKLKKIPIIFLSATNDEYQMLCAMDAGGHHYVPKPIAISLLSEIVFDILALQENFPNQVQA